MDGTVSVLSKVTRADVRRQGKKTAGHHNDARLGILPVARP
jgi:hypothetical protein